MCNVGFQLLWRQPQKERASAEHSLACSLHQRLPQREGKTQQGHPGSNLTWVSTSWCPASCKQQVVTLVFEASHHFWWAPLKQKQRSVPEPNRIQMVLQSLSLFHTHTHTLCEHHCLHPIPTLEPSRQYGDSCACSVPNGADILVNRQFLSSEAKQPITDGLKLSVHRIICPFKCRFLCRIPGVSNLVGQGCGLRAGYSTSSPCDLDTCTANHTPVWWLSKRCFTERIQECFIASACQKWASSKEGGHRVKRAELEHYYYEREQRSDLRE